MLSSHRYQGRLLLRGAPLVRARRRRGVTLIATVLLSLLAATIGMVVVRQSVLSTRTTTARGDFAAADAAAQAGRSDFERALANDPRFYLHGVTANERARICTYSGGSVTVQPPADGAPDVAWPPAGHPECASRWSYVTAASEGVVREEITPPSPSDVNLHLRLLAAVGGGEAGLSADYRMDTVGKFTAYTAGDLTVDNLTVTAPVSAGATPAPLATLAGGLYAGGTLTVPVAAPSSSTTAPASSAPTTAPAATTTLAAGTQAFAEGGIIGAPGVTDRFYTGGADEPGVRPIRQTLPDVESLEGLRTTARRLSAIGCPGGDPVNYTTGNQYASSLCLAAGAKLMPAAGTGPGSLVTVPAATAYLLVFGGPSAPDTVEVYAATVAPDTTATCSGACTPAARSAAAESAGTFPGAGVGAGSLWGAALGSFRLPVTGVIAADADVYLSQCATFAATGGTCPALNGSPTPGMQVGRSVTVVAGTFTAPRDVYLSGPITTSGDARLGVVATGGIILPYWARQSGGALSIAAALVSLGEDQSGTVPTPAIRSLPATLPPSTGHADLTYASALTLTGTIAGPSLSLATLAGYDSVTLVADPTVRADPPPYLPGFTDTWSRYGSAWLPSAAVCGLPSCAGIW